MSVTGPAPSTEALPTERLEGLFAELAELAGQRNAIDGPTATRCMSLVTVSSVQLTVSLPRPLTA